MSVVRGDHGSEGDDCDAFCYAKEMGLTLHDFLRLLPAATASTQQQWQRDPAGITIDQGQSGRRVRIEIAAEAERRIASLSLPVLSIRLLLSRFSADEAAAFIKCFDRHYQRGGG